MTYAGLADLVAPHHVVYTMRDLNQHTARVMGEIEAAGKVAFLSNHGRLVAMILPLRGEIASSVLAEMIRKYSQHLTADGAEEHAAEPAPPGLSLPAV